MAPGKPRVVFRVMDGASLLGLRDLRREFGQYGEIVCASLRADSARFPQTVEIEFADSKSTLKVKDWTGEGSHLALYRPEGLVDAFRRDIDVSFLCLVDGFGNSLNNFRDLAAFGQYVTDCCSATLNSCALCWSASRGVFAQVECAQKADQERILGKVMAELFMGKRLSASSVCGGEYAGMNAKSYRVDWKVVASEAAVLGIERNEGERIRKKEKAQIKNEKPSKKDKKKDKKDKKKDKKDKKKEKKDKQKEKKEKEKSGKKQKLECKSSASDSESEPAKTPSAPVPEPGQKPGPASSSSSASASPQRLAVRPKQVPPKVPFKITMASMADEASEPESDG
ncbi:unnamed protein product [Polarella glacialis]|uniref:Uncharacterized protein n=1 Tax=Polarella glacialis TaxID=89957 RepID=A0A813GBJ2_POLGL|nr:unnamed protein product [Polarella glacialis]